MYNSEIRTAVVNEYLVGAGSSRELGKKYEVSCRSVSRWVRAYDWASRQEALYTKVATLADMHQEDEIKKKAALDQAAEILELKKQLEAERLHNKLLTAMIDIAEEELKIPIRKKYGTRQSKK